MADTKISALTGATTPLAGTEVVPVVQSATTKNVSIADLTAGRTVSCAALTTTGSVGVNTSSPASPLDVVGSNGITISANKTDATSKTGRLRYQHYTNAEEPMTGLLAISGASTNILNLGGGSAAENAATEIRFYTAATNTTVTGTQAMTINSSGNVLVVGTGGLGYGTGSGGAVTQITSRTTGVTLNKTNGAITLVSAAGSTSWQSFTVTNSTVAATDVVKVCQKSGTDLYMIHVTAVAAGSFRISFATTGGTTTEQPVFNFAVIKAVTA